MSQHPFVPAHNDLLLGRRLQLRSPRLAILEGSLRPEEVMAVFGSLSAAVCMRYHSLLFAARAGTPIIPVFLQIGLSAEMALASALLNRLALLGTMALGAALIVSGQTGSLARTNEGTQQGYPAN
jgi:hypothetical protein